MYLDNLNALNFPKCDQLRGKSCTSSAEVGNNDMRGGNFFN